MAGINHPAVAIIDDDKRSRERISSFIRTQGFTPLMFDHVQSLEQLVATTADQKIEYAICDHRLSERNYAPFLGAAAVARLYDARVTPLLVTGYETDDAETSIRFYRKKVPVLLQRLEMAPKTLASYLQVARKEVVEGILPPERQPCRSIMTVTSVISRAEPVVKVLVFQFDAHEEVGFPLSLVPREIRSRVRPGAFLVAEVNVDATKPEDLYFDNIGLPDDDAIRAIETNVNNP